MADKNEMPFGVAIVVVAIVVAVILYVPLLTIWGINTLVVVPCKGDEIPYAFFTKYWWAALICGGGLWSILGISKVKAKE